MCVCACVMVVLPNLSLSLNPGLPVARPDIS